MSWRTHPLVRFLASLKLAVVVMGVSMVTMATGTIVESHWNADLARLYLYQAPWFHAVLVLLFLNVLTSLLVRTPLTPRLYGFATTHVGILTILFGATLTAVYGIDGMLEFSEGESTSALRLPVPVVRHYVDEQMVGEAKVSKGILRRGFGFPSLPGQPDSCRILEYMPFASIRQKIVPAPGGIPVMELGLATGRGAPTVVQLALDNPLLAAEQDLGLVDIRLEKTNSVKSFLDTTPRIPDFHLAVVAGPDSVPFALGELVPGREKKAGAIAVKVVEFHPDAVLDSKGLSDRSKELANPVVRLAITRDGKTWQEVLYGAMPEFRLSGAVSQGVRYPMAFVTASKAVERPTIRFAAAGDSLACRIEAHGKIKMAFPVVRGEVVQTPFGVVTLSVGVWEPHGDVRDSAVPADIRPGQSLPPSAIRVSAGPWGAARWLPHGGFFGWQDHGRNHLLSFEDRRVTLPFGLRLDRFTVGHDPGTMQAASYASDVTVLDGTGRKLDTAHIAMNQPLHRNGFTLYQASFVQGDGAVSRSVLSVNRDPGRPFKYFGCLVLITGIIWHTLIRAKRKNKETQNHA